MEFKKYQHIERFGTTPVKGITEGTVYVFPKIDGTNGSVWNDNGIVKAGSRNRELTLDFDNAGFYKHILKQDNIIELIKHHPKTRLFGEFLVQHTLKTYQAEAWNKFYVFDVMQNDQYMNYEDYIKLLKMYHIEFIPAICKIQNPTPSRLYNLLDENKYLIKDGAGTGEGIVLKNYDFVNKFGNKKFAKIVKNEFKTEKYKNDDVRIVKEKQIVEDQIVNKYVTESLVEKEFAKIEAEPEGFSSRSIPRLLNTVFYCLVTEEIYNAIKHFKTPTIDFKLLKYHCFNKTKEIKQELF